MKIKYDDNTYNIIDNISLTKGNIVISINEKLYNLIKDDDYVYLSDKILYTLNDPISMRIYEIIEYTNSKNFRISPSFISRVLCIHDKDCYELLGLINKAILNVKLTIDSIISDIETIRYTNYNDCISVEIECYDYHIVTQIFDIGIINTINNYLRISSDKYVYYL